MMIKRLLNSTKKQKANIKLIINELAWFRNESTEFEYFTICISCLRGTWEYSRYTYWDILRSCINFMPYHEEPLYNSIPGYCLYCNCKRKTVKIFYYNGKMITVLDV